MGDPTPYRRSRSDGRSDGRAATTPGTRSAAGQKGCRNPAGEQGGQSGLFATGRSVWLWHRDQADRKSASRSRLTPIPVCVWTVGFTRATDSTSRSKRPSKPPTKHRLSTRQRIRYPPAPRLTCMTSSAPRPTSIDPSSAWRYTWAPVLGCLRPEGAIRDTSLARKCF
jgi:hypothetical protein